MDITTITTIPTSELEKDLYDIEDDIRVCRFFIEIGALSCNGGLVQERLKDNKRLFKAITEEINRRKTTP